MELNPTQMFADLFALLCLAGVVMNAFYFNWRGIIVSASFAAYAHYHPGDALTCLMLCIFIAGGCFIRALSREAAGKPTSTFSVLEFIGETVDRVRR